jgi:predicted aldo/keto reductase-like oxidoreductase
MSNLAFPSFKPYLCGRPKGIRQTGFKRDQSTVGIYVRAAERLRTSRNSGENRRVDRRKFIFGTSLLTAIGAFARPALAGQIQSSSGKSEEDDASTLPTVTDDGEMRGEMLYRLLGSTGERVSAIGLGGSHIAKPTIAETESIRLIHEAIDRGITFMNNSWDYNQGQSEARMGKALTEGAYRDKVFLMTKLDGRTKDSAMRQIETSLERLKTDHVDLLQHHEILRFDDPDRIFGEDGAMEAFVEAKKARKLRFIGFTGHKDPRVHLYMLETAARHGFRFDTVQMPLNVLDAHFRSFAHRVLPRLVEAKIGVLGMKTFGGADGIILKSKAIEPIDCLHYSLNLPAFVVITGIDNQKVLDQAFEAVRTFHPMSEEEIAAIVAKTQRVATDGKYELFKTSSHFDTTARHPDWLGDDSPAVQSLAPQSAG